MTFKECFGSEFEEANFFENPGGARAPPGGASASPGKAIAPPGGHMTCQVPMVLRPCPGPLISSYPSKAHNSMHGFYNIRKIR